PDRRIGAEGAGVRRPAARAMVEADLQRDRELGRRADRPPARPAFRRGRAGRARARARRRGEGSRPRRRRRAVGGPLGDERARDPARPRPPAVDARGRRSPPADGDRVDHRRASSRGGAVGHRGRAPLDALPARQSEGGKLLVKICIVGCGAVGSLFAANLAQLDDVEVWAYDASREHVDAINANGLRLSGAGDVVARLRATTDAHELPSCDFGIVATKAMHTDTAIAATAHAFADGFVATVQNGLGNEETLAQHVPRVIRGTTFPAGKILEPGHVQWDVKGDTTLGPFGETPLGEVAKLADACTRGGMPTQAVEDARGPQWRKVIFNASTN